jgi:DNA-binding CsgD family transcriptional regulator
MIKSKIIQGIKWSILSFAFLYLVQESTQISLFSGKDLQKGLLLILCTWVLTLIGKTKEQTISEKKQSFRFNLFFSAGLLSLLSSFAFLQQSQSPFVLSGLLEGLRPLLYSLIIYPLIINGFSQKEFFISNKEIEERLLTPDFSQDEPYKESIHMLDLSRRELEIVQLIFCGLSNKEIAINLYIQESTVKKHVQHIFKKAQCKDRIELIKLYKL